MEAGIAAMEDCEGWMELARQVEYPSRIVGLAKSRGYVYKCCKPVGF